jgi:hypothetical protein
MANNRAKSTILSSPYVLGRKTFAAITAVEGLKLSAAGEQRLEKTVELSPDQRRAEVIRAYMGRKGRR